MLPSLNVRKTKQLCFKWLYSYKHSAQNDIVPWRTVTDQEKKPKKSVVHLELRISLRIFENFETALMVYSEGLGETDSWKNQKSKSRDPVPLRVSF